MVNLRKLNIDKSYACCEASVRAQSLNSSNLTSMKFNISLKFG